MVDIDEPRPGNRRGFVVWALVRWDPPTTGKANDFRLMRERRRQRARLIAKVFEVDPLHCACGGTMRVVAFILDSEVIRKILQHRPRTEPRAPARLRSSVSPG